MSYGENRHFESLKLPMTWTVIGIVAFVIVVAAILFLGDRREAVTEGAYGARGAFDSVSEPVNGAITSPVKAVGNGTNWIDDYLFAVRENVQLRKEVLELQQYRDKYIQQKEINARYEALLNLRTEPFVETVVARSVLMSHGPYNNSRVIDAGAAKGIKFGHPVITEHGLIGRISGVSPNVSRILMVTDVVSHVPVMVMRTNGRAMMNGDGGGHPRLDFVRGRDTVREGDQIVTSGDGGIFPRGLPVGEARRGFDGVWRVKLYADRMPIDYVKVLKFNDFSNLPDADTVLRAPPITQVLPAPATVANPTTAPNGQTPPATGAALATAPAATKPQTPKPETVKKPTPTAQNNASSQAHTSSASANPAPATTEAPQ